MKYRKYCRLRRVRIRTALASAVIIAAVSGLSLSAAHADPVKDVKTHVPIVIKETKALEALHKQAIELAAKIKASAEKRQASMAAIDHAMDRLVVANEKVHAELEKHLGDMGKVLEAEAKVFVAFNKAMDEARHASDH